MFFSALLKSGSDDDEKEKNNPEGVKDLLADSFCPQTHPTSSLKGITQGQHLLNRRRKMLYTLLRVLAAYFDYIYASTAKRHSKYFS